MRILRLKVSDQELIRTPGCDFSNVIVDTSGHLQAAFGFGQDWDGVVQVTAFYPYFQSWEVSRLTKDGTCIAPDEVTAYDTFRAGVIGQRKNGQRITTDLITIKQERGSGQVRQQ